VSRAFPVAVLAIAGMLAACASPEATRARAQGPGADVRNVGQIVRMHEGADPYWRTPRVRDVGAPPLETARQADQLSR
jgi:hypothetical protein